MIEFDHVKREMTLFTRGLDMARSSEVFASPHMNQLDDRKNYGETRIITFGYLDHLPIVLVWTYRGNTKRIISLRKANEREIKKMSKDLVDPDDAPELDKKWFRDAHVYVGDTLIKRGVGRPPIKNTKVMLSLRLDFDVLEKLRASGKGWQTRLSNHIKEAVLKGAL